MLSLKNTCYNRSRKDGMKLEIRQLEYFLAVCETGSFTRAAERLYVSQPAVTAAIRALEDELGILLFDRKQKLASLTAEGKIFATHVQQVMHGISQTLEEIDAMKNLASGVLNIGLNPFCALPDFCDIVKSFAARYPAIKIKLTEADDTDLINLLIDDKLDLAILCSSPSSNALSMQSLPAQEILLCFQRRHRFHRQNSVTPAEFLPEPLLLPDADSTYRKELLRKLKLAADLQPTLESSHIQTIKSLLSANLGLSLLPEPCCYSDTELATAAIEPPIYLEPCLARKEARHLSHAAEAFLACVSEALGGENNDTK